MKASETKLPDVKLYNKGKAVIYGAHADVIDPLTKRPAPYEFHPQKSAAFSADEATKLRRLYPDAIQSLDDVQREFSERTEEKIKTAAAVIPVEQAEEEKRQAVEAAVAKALANAAKKPVSKVAEQAEEEKRQGDDDKDVADTEEGDDFAQKNTIAKAGGGIFGGKKPK